MECNKKKKKREGDGFLAAPRRTAGDDDRPKINKNVVASSRAGLACNTARRRPTRSMIIIQSPVTINIFNNFFNKNLPATY